MADQIVIVVDLCRWVEGYVVPVIKTLNILFGLC